MAAAPLLIASVAHACTQLTNLAVNPTSGASGVTVQVSGSNYRTDATSGPVEIRLNSRTAPVIATLPVTSINPNGRTIAMSVPIPANLAIGYQTLIATQVNTSTGALLSGFPVRAAYKVTGAAGGRTEASTEASAVVPEPAAPIVAAEPGRAEGGPAAPGVGVAAPVLAGAERQAAPSGGTVALPASGPTSARGPIAPATPGGSPAPAVVPEVTAPTDAASLAPAAVSTGPLVETVRSGMIPVSAGGTGSPLPAVTLALGIGVALLSLLAFVTSGRAVLTGRVSAAA